MKVHFAELGKDFVSHYFKLFADSPSNVTPMYSEEAELHVGGQVILGRESIVASLATAGNLTVGNHMSQPYGQSDVLVTASVRSSSHSFVMTFILAEVGEGNQFGVSYHFVHVMPE
jgi:hypothetical protein